MINGDPEDHHLQQLLSDIQQQIELASAAAAAAAAGEAGGQASYNAAVAGSPADKSSGSHNSGQDSSMEPFHWPEFIAAVHKSRESRLATGGRRVGICLTKGSLLPLVDGGSKKEQATAEYIDAKEGRKVEEGAMEQKTSKEGQVGRPPVAACVPVMTLWSQVRQVSNLCTDISF